VAALRNLAIGALHLAGRHDTTEATRWASRPVDRPLHHPRTHIMVLKRPCWLGSDAHGRVFFTSGDRTGQAAVTAAV